MFLFVNDLFEQFLVGELKNLRVFLFLGLLLNAHAEGSALRILELSGFLLLFLGFAHGSGFL